MSKLVFPTEVLNQHVVVLGKTGAGKSSALRHAVEYLLEQKKRVCIIDIKGDWWGLKSSADGKHAGFPIITFGNFREPKATDVPINAQSGKHIAELITSGNRPCIIGFRGWMPHEITEFWIGTEQNRWNGFASTLFNSNQGELYVVISECHNFAPKGKVPDPKSARVLHWTNRLLSEGRGLGMTFMLDSQRPQKVHNDTLTSCDTLIGMRLTHPADREAVQAWINGCGDKVVGAQVMNSLGLMQRGEGWVWSSEIGFGPKRIQFPMFKTFDSFAPAQLQKKVSDSGWSEVDLDAVKEKLASVIKEAEDTDPKALKLKIAKLEKELREASKNVAPAVETDPAKLKQLVDAALVDVKNKYGAEVDRRLREYRDHLDKELGVAVADIMTTLHRTVAVADASFNPSPMDIDKDVKITFPQTIKFNPNPFPTKAEISARGHDPKAGIIGRAAAISIDRESGVGSTDLPKGERDILIAIAQHSNTNGGAERVQLSILTGYKKSTRNAYLQRLAQKGFVFEQNDKFTITVAGATALGSDYEPLPTGAALCRHWLTQLPNGEAQILRLLEKAYPDALTRVWLSEVTGFQKSTRNSYLQRMSAKKIITSNGDFVWMAKELSD